MISLIISSTNIISRLSLYNFGGAHPSGYCGVMESVYSNDKYKKD